MEEIRQVMQQVSALEAESKSSGGAMQTVEAETDVMETKPAAQLSPQHEVTQRSEADRTKEKQEHDALLDMMG